MFFFTLQGEKEHTKNIKYHAAAGENCLLRKSYNRENDFQKSKAYFITALILFWRAT